MKRNEKAVRVAREILNTSSIESIISSILEAKTAKIQLIIVDSFNAVAQEQGRYAGGAPSLGDKISDSLAAKVKRGLNHKLSERQIAVIAREIFDYRIV